MKKLHVIFSFFCILFIISITPLIERLTFIGQPNLSMVRFALAIISIALFVFNKYFKYEDIAVKRNQILPLILYYALSIYVVIMSLNNLQDVTFYLLYCNFIFVGFYFANEKKLVYLDSFIICLCGIAIIIGWIMFILGPERLLTLGIGPVSGKWGQFITTDLLESVGSTLHFRVFSLFFDHQSYSAFLQLCSVYYRFRYEVTHKKVWLSAIMVSLISNIVTFSVTGLIIITCILLSILTKKRLFFLVLLLGLAIYGCYLITPSFFQFFFHVNSMIWRSYFIQNIFNSISWTPHPFIKETFDVYSVGFTSDCYILWMAYVMGIGYIFIWLTMLLSFFWSIRKSQQGYKMMSIFGLIYLISVLSNGAYLNSTFNNILFPLLLGLIWTFNYKSNYNVNYLTYVNRQL